MAFEWAFEKALRNPLTTVSFLCYRIKIQREKNCFFPRWKNIQ